MPLISKHIMHSRVSARGLIGEGKSGRVKGHVRVGSPERQTDKRKKR